MILIGFLVFLVVVVLILGSQIYTRWTLPWYQQTNRSTQLKKYLKQSYASFDHGGIHGRSLVSTALYFHDRQCLAILLPLCSVAYLKKNQYFTEAILWKDLQCVQLMFAQCPTINALDDNQKTPLMWATTTACPVVMTYFLTHTNQNINTCSPCYGNIVSYMLLEQIDLALFQSVLDQPQLNINAFVPPDNLTCLMIAVKLNLPDYVTLLLSHPRIDIFLRNSGGYKALDYATSRTKLVMQKIFNGKTV